MVQSYITEVTQKNTAYNRCKSLSGHMVLPTSVGDNSLITDSMARLNITDIWLDAEMHASFWHSATGEESLIVTNCK